MAQKPKPPLRHNPLPARPLDTVAIQAYVAPMRRFARNPKARRPRCLPAAALAALTLTGCLERTIRVTSDPPGAIVWLNDVEIGQTPAQARFKFYGVYDVRLELPGYEPIHEGREAKAPFHEYPGPDLIASALPSRIHTTLDWHYTLTPSPPLADPAAEDAFLDRARALRTRLGPAPAADPAPQPEPDQTPRPEPPVLEPDG